jgi:hypothetical protein
VTFAKTVPTVSRRDGPPSVHRLRNPAGVPDRNAVIADTADIGNERVNQLVDDRTIGKGDPRSRFTIGRVVTPSDVGDAGVDGAAFCVHSPFWVFRLEWFVFAGSKLYYSAC